MNIVLVGYGRMGKAIEEAALGRNHTIIGKVDPMTKGDDIQPQLTLDLLKKADAVIEFALPQGIKANTELYIQSGVPTIIGTTGWESLREEISELTKKNNGSILWGNNFSIGAHLLFKLTAEASRLIEGLSDYDIMVHEFHHKMKKDSPSGTALTIAENILKNNKRKTKLLTQSPNRAIEPEELQVIGIRGGFIPGVHTVTIDGPHDTIELTHTARNRSGFAIGSVLAAEWLINKKGFFPVEDFINDLFQ